jgi:imidazolonepropionase-like amidohydrolase
MGVEDRYGSIGVGRSATMVLWSGDPLEFSSQPVRMWIDGAEQSLRSRQTELFERYRTLEPGFNSLP